MSTIEQGRSGRAPARATVAPRLETPPLTELEALRAEIAKLRESVRLRDERTALVLHELRQPLNVLTLTTAYVAKNAVGDEKARLDHLREASYRLDTLISDMTDASFLESGAFALHVAPTDIAKLVASCASHLAAPVIVSVGEEVPLLDVDPGRIEQVLTNLLVNARKYACAGTAPRVAITRNGDVVDVVVTNDGRSLASDERTKVFEPYYRGRDRKQDARGLGLGLYICKLLVEEHGGAIWTGGDAYVTRFSVRLPIVAPASRASVTRIASKPRRAGDTRLP